MTISANPYPLKNAVENFKSVLFGLTTRCFKEKGVTPDAATWFSLPEGGSLSVHNQARALVTKRRRLES